MGHLGQDAAAQSSDKFREADQEGGSGEHHETSSGKARSRKVNQDRFSVILVQARGKRPESWPKQHLQVKNKEVSKTAGSGAVSHSRQGHRDPPLGRLSNSQTCFFL